MPSVRSSASHIRSVRLRVLIIVSLAVAFATLCLGNTPAWADSGSGSPLAGLTAAPNQDAATLATAAQTASTVTAFMTSQLASYRKQYSAGEWNDAFSDVCWGCDEGGPTTAAATLYVLSGEQYQDLLNLAVDSVDAAISDHQESDGGFTTSYTDGVSEQIETMFYGVELGTTDLLLSDYVPAATRTRWANSLQAAANYLISSGATTWYANGNINLGYTELLWLAWHATGEASLSAAYNASLNFTIAPPQSQFPGAGWHTVTAGTAANGSDGAGYFAETGAGGTGFDPYYTMIQLDVAARLYLLSGDARVLRLTNMLTNQLMPLVDTSAWTLKTSNGTRHTAAGTSELFQTSALAVLGFEGGRSDLVGDIKSELAAQITGYQQDVNAPDLASFRRAFGNSVATIALASAVAQLPSSSSTTAAGTSTTTTTTTSTPPTTATTTTTTATTPTTTSTTPTTTSTTTTTTPPTTTSTTSTSAPPTSTSTKSAPVKHKPVRVAVQKAARARAAAISRRIRAARAHRLAHRAVR